ncbi:DegT/DnrJ/EryC1/StrS family aminotransferase [Spirochaeta dissipatitropha]
MNQDIEQIPFGKPCLGTEEEEAVLRIMRSGWLTTGSECALFEQEFAELVGVPYAIAVSSATAGLHLALEACGIGPGDAVVTSTLTFAATAEVICSLGARPVFADIDPETANICPEAAEKAIVETRAKALIPVHMGGLGCDMTALKRIAKHHNCSIIEDAAHSLPACEAGRYSGTDGDVGVYSFYANKTMTTGEGGMIVCRDKRLAERMKLLRMHGIDRDVWKRYTDSTASWRYDITAAGYKYNLPDMLAAVGRIQLKKVHSMQAERARIAAAYSHAFADCSWLALPPVPLSGEQTAHSWHLYQIRLTASDAEVRRDEFIQKLQAEGIGVSVHFIPLHTMTYYRDLLGYREQDFPAAMNWFHRCISLPVYPDLADSQLQRIILTVRRIGGGMFGSSQQ